MPIPNTPMIGGTPSLHGRRLGLNSTGALVGQDGHPFLHGSGNLQSETTATTITNWGNSLLTSTSTAAVFTLAAPVAGAIKRLVFNAAQSTTTKIVTASSAVTFASSADSFSLTITSTLGAADKVIDLIGRSSTGWRVAGQFSFPTTAIATATT